MENKTTNRSDEFATEVVVPAVDATVVPAKSKDVIPLNYEKALASYSEEEQREIRALADSIDVTKIENVMSYGEVPLKATFEQCGELLKVAKGSNADQRVIAQVIDLSKRASESYEDFNLVLQEPNLFQKLFLKIFKSHKEGQRMEKIQNSAVTSYNFVNELMNSYDSWLDMLKEAMGEIEYSALSDIETIGLLEKYIIAGKLAEERIANELIEMEAKHQETGLQQYSYAYEETKEGFDSFLITLSNLEKSRAMYQLSIAQLALTKRSNRNVQISIHTQRRESMALIGQQLRNAVLNAKTQEVLEGQQAIIRLNDELIKEVSKTIGKTAEETEQLIYTGFYSMEAAKEAISTVITSCTEIQKTGETMLPQMRAELAQIEGMLKELEPCVSGIKLPSTDTEVVEPKTPSTEGKKLKF